MPKITALPAASSVTSDDYIPIVNAPGSVPVTQYATLAQLRTSLFAGGSGYTATDPLTCGAISTSGDFAIATNKFTVASASGNTVIAGTLAAGKTTIGGDTVVAPFITLNGTDGSSKLLKYFSAGAVKWEVYSNATDHAYRIDSTSVNVLNITQAGLISVTSTTQSTSTTTGALVVSGGLGVAKGISMADGEVLLWGTSANRIFFNGGAFRIDVNGSQRLGIATDGTVSLNNALSVTGTSTFSNDLLAATNGNIDIGKTGSRFANGWINNVTSSGTITAGTLSVTSTSTLTGVVGIGSALARADLYISKAMTASYGSAFAVYIEPTLTTAANSDSLYGVRVGATYVDAGHSTTVAYGIYLDAVTGCDTNYAIYSAGGTNYFAGNVGIGTTSPAYLLQLSSDSAAKPSTNTWTISSDERIKQDILPYSDGLAMLLNIQPISYAYNGLGGFAASEDRHIGISAQALQAVAPYMISSHLGKLHPEDAEDTEILDYNGHAMTFALINAVKELHARLVALEAN